MANAIRPLSLSLLRRRRPHQEGRHVVAEADDRIVRLACARTPVALRRTPLAFRRTPVALRQATLALRRALGALRPSLAARGLGARGGPPRLVPTARLLAGARLAAGGGAGGGPGPRV